jgi:hypothetical protein
MGKRVIVGQSEWGLDDGDVDKVTGQIQSAMESGAVVELELLDTAGRVVTVYLNGKVAETVVIDLDRGPRPSEIV